MREYKFRGKRIDNEEWVYGNLIYDNISDKYWIDLSINESEKVDGGLHIYAVEVIPETIGQYTGLHDKDGKEIYKGDIVKAYISGRWLIGKIIYEHSGFTIDVTNNKELEFGRRGIIEKFTKVIGNVYEDKDLLEN